MSDDIQQQWRELEENYAHMADEELETLAAEGYELTDIARRALTRQIAARGLKFTVNLIPPPDDEPNDDEPQGDFDPAELSLVHCTDVWSADEARIILEALHSVGLPAYLEPDLVEKVEDFRGNFEKGIELLVRDVDRQRAYSVLSQVKLPHTNEPNDMVSDALPCCPKCNSEEIVFLELDDTPVSSGGDEKFHWHCDACGHDWEDDGVSGS